MYGQPRADGMSGKTPAGNSLQMGMPEQCRNGGHGWLPRTGVVIRTVIATAAAILAQS